MGINKKSFLSSIKRLNSSNVNRKVSKAGANIGRKINKTIKGAEETVSNLNYVRKSNKKTKEMQKELDAKKAKNPEPTKRRKITTFGNVKYKKKIVGGGATPQLKKMSIDISKGKGYVGGGASNELTELSKKMYKKGK